MDKNEIDIIRRIDRYQDISGILENADETIRSNKDIMTHAILRWRGAFQYASDELKKDKTFVIDYLNSHYVKFPLAYASHEVRTDIELLLYIAKMDPMTLAEADRSVLDDKEFMKKVVTISAIPFGYSKLRRDKEFVEEVIGINGMTFSYADESLWENRQLLMKAVKNNGDVMNHLPISSHYLQQYLEDEELLIEAAKSMISKSGTYGFGFNLSQEMRKKLDENKELEKLSDEYWTKRRQELKTKKEELSSLEAEEKTISEAEILIDRQNEGQNIGE